MLEAEIAFCQDLEPLLSTMETLVKQSAKIVLEHGNKDLAIIGKYYNENLEVFARVYKIFTWIGLI